jgi:phosphoserine phosphatase RsbU/P
VQRVWSGLAAFSAERFVTLVAALIAPDDHQLRYVNAGHPSIALWGRGRKVVWMESTGPFVSPVLPACRWEMPVVEIGEGDQLLLYTDGVSDVLADTDGYAEARFTETIARASEGGAPLLDAILSDVHRDLAGQPQADDFTLMTAKILSRVPGA